jgi:hypothetical protein
VLIAKSTEVFKQEVYISADKHSWAARANDPTHGEPKVLYLLISLLPQRSAPDTCFVVP